MRPPILQGILPSLFPTSPYLYNYTYIHSNNNDYFDIYSNCTDGVAWDWVNKKLYWTDAGHNTIEVFDQATGQRMTLINTGRDSNPRGLVVDPTTRFDLYILVNRYQE